MLNRWPVLLPSPAQACCLKKRENYNVQRKTTGGLVHGATVARRQYYKSTSLRYSRYGGGEGVSTVDPTKRIKLIRWGSRTVIFPSFLDTKLNPESTVRLKVIAFFSSLKYIRCHLVGIPLPQFLIFRLGFKIK